LILVFLFSVIFFVNKKYENEVTFYCKSVQAFFNSNKLKIFGGLCFILVLSSLIFLSAFESLTGLMFFFNVYLLMLVLKEGEVLYMSFFFVSLACYRVFTNQVSGWSICILILVYYFWGVMSLLFGLPDTEKCVQKVQEAQEPVLFHMKTELSYFLVLDEMVLLYFMSKYTCGSTFLLVLGPKLVLICDVYAYEALAICMLVKLIAIWVFNPGTGNGVKVVNSFVGCGGLVVAGAALGLEANRQATSGCGLEPPRNWVIKHIQKSRWGVTASSSLAIDTVKIWEQVHGTVPPKVVGTDEIDLPKTIKILKNEPNKELRSLIQHMDPKYKA